MPIHITGEVFFRYTDIECDTVDANANCDVLEKLIIEALVQGSMSLDEITQRTDLNAGVAAGAMTMLVLKGLVAQKPGNVFVLKRR